MRTSMAWLALLCCGAFSFGSFPLNANADSFSMSAGMQDAFGPLCYRWSTTPNGAIGATRSTDSSCFNERYVMPLYWTNFFYSFTARTVSVTARVPDSSSLLGCTLSVYNSNGVLVSQSSGSFPVTGAGYSNINLTVNSILASSSSFISCTGIGSSTYLMKVDYSPRDPW